MLHGASAHGRRGQPGGLTQAHCDHPEGSHVGHVRERLSQPELALAAAAAPPGLNSLRPVLSLNSSSRQALG